MGSQKELLMAISVVSFLPASLGDTGVMVIAMTLSHLTILIVDSILVVVWNHIDCNRGNRVAESNQVDP